MQANLEFVASLEEIKHVEKKQKQASDLLKKQQKKLAAQLRAAKIAKMQVKRKETYESAQHKLGLGKNEPMFKRHARHLTGPEIKVPCTYS